MRPHWSWLFNYPALSLTADGSLATFLSHSGQGRVQLCRLSGYTPPSARVWCAALYRKGGSAAGVALAIAIKYKDRNCLSSDPWNYHIPSFTLDWALQLMFKLVNCKQQELWRSNFATIFTISKPICSSWQTSHFLTLLQNCNVSLKTSLAKSLILAHWNLSKFLAQNQNVSL